MKRVFIFILLSALMLSFSSFAEAKRSKPGKINRGSFRDIVTSVNSAKDSNSLYVLGEKSIEKYSLPDLMLILSVDLPTNSEGKGVEVVGGCTDQNPTILVSVEKSGDEVILSYNKDLQLIATLAIKTVSSDIENEENNNNDNGDNENDNGDNNDKHDNND